MADIRSFVKVLVVDCFQGLDYGRQVQHLPIHDVLVETNFSEPRIVLDLDVEAIFKVRVPFLDGFPESGADFLKWN